MKKFKKLLCVILAFAVIFTVACSKEAVTETSADNGSESKVTSGNSSKETSSEEKKAENVEYVIDGYLKNEYDETITNSLKLMKDSKFSYIFMTDMHIDYDDVNGEIIRQCKIAVKLANELKVDCIILGGDIIHGCNTHYASINWINKIADILKDADCPTFTALGNHDRNPYHSATGETNKCVPEEFIIKDDEWCASALNEKLTRGMIVHDSMKENSSYYYVDFKDKKTRAIFLDPFDFPIEIEDGYLKYVSETWNKLSDRQMAWLASEALNGLDSGWDIKVYCHSPLSGFGNAAFARKILASYNNREKLTMEAYGTDVDYTSAKANISLYHYGHTHVDGGNYDTYAKLLTLNTGNAKTKPAYPNNGGLPRERGTYTEALFDVIVCSKTGKVDRIRFGAGIDETF